MYQKRFILISLLAVLTAAVPTFGQNATLRLVASQASIQSGERVTVEAFISNLPVEMSGYQLGLDITGGTSGQITAAPFDGSVDVDSTRPDWVFREVADAGTLIISAGDRRDPPRLFSLISTSNVGVQPVGERYMGTFVLEASSDAAGDFNIAILPPDASPDAALILFPVLLGDPPIPATISSVNISVQFVASTCSDVDGDGYGFPGDASCPNGAAEDCNDGDPLINPGATEIWYDGIDQNCDAANDFDQDGDGFVCDSGSAFNSCPGGVGNDCNDTNVAVFPGAPELCDGLDNDCNGQVDDAGACAPATAALHLVASATSIDPGQQVTVEAFIDNLPVALHGYQIGLDITGGMSGQITAAQFPDAVVVDNTRADWAFREIADAQVKIISAGDQRFPPRLFSLIFPSGVGALPQNARYLGTFVLEASSDAVGEFQIGITPPDVTDSGAGTILITIGGSTFPANVDDPSVIPVTSASVAMRVRGVPPTCIDSDGDGYGSPGDPTCPNGPENDCNDLDPLIHPGAVEIWYDGVDQNCDGLDDFDQDGDGFVCDASSSSNACPGGVGTDCNDTNTTVHPGAVELCDGLDNDCNNLIDDSPGCAVPAVSEWGLVVMILLILTAGTVVLARRKQWSAC